MKNYRAERNGARGPGFFELDTRFGYGFNLPNRRRLEVSADIFNLTNHTNFAQPDRQRSGVRRLVPGADRIQHQLHAAQGADRARGSNFSYRRDAGCFDSRLRRPSSESQAASCKSRVADRVAVASCKSRVGRSRAGFERESRAASREPPITRFYILERCALFQATSAIRPPLSTRVRLGLSASC